MKCTTLHVLGLDYKERGVTCKHGRCTHDSRKHPCASDHVQPTSPDHQHSSRVTIDLVPMRDTHQSSQAGCMCSHSVLEPLMQCMTLSYMPALGTTHASCSGTSMAFESSVGTAASLQHSHKLACSPLQALNESIGAELHAA